MMTSLHMRRTNAFQHLANVVFYAEDDEVVWNMWVRTYKTLGEMIIGDGPYYSDVCAFSNQSK